MKRIMIVVLLVGLVGASLSAVPAQAKKKKKAKPVPVTFHAHGEAPFGELEIPNALDGIFMPMDTADPAGGAPKSMGFTNYVGGPNPKCSGNPFFPVWVGKMAGSVKGDIKIKFTSIAGPAAQLDVRIWPDGQPLACNDSYPEPASSAVVDLPAGEGETEVVIEGMNFPVVNHLMIQFSPVIPSATQGRLLYDSADADLSIELLCTPASGTSCTP